MDLSDIELYVGVVVDIDDPKHEGRVKATCPGLFDIETMGLDGLFWIPPLTINYQNYSQLNKGNKVYIFHNKKNYYGYRYLPFFELNTDTKNLIDNTDVDILISRSGDDGPAQLYYKNDTGMMNTVGEGYINIERYGDIVINGAKTVDVYADLTKIGKNGNGEFQQAVLGKNLRDLLLSIGNDLIAIGGKISFNPHTFPLGGELIKLGQKIVTKSGTILSDHVKLN